MHTIWKGSISFGLVNIPIKLHAATEDKDISLRTLHKECHSPIKYEKVCPVCQKEVGKEDIVRAFEYTKGKFVVLEDNELEELKKQNEEKSVEIMDFVKIEEIDPIYFNRSYFMSPNDGGIKAYSLLRQALKESNKVGLAKIIIRSKEQMAVIRVVDNTLLMETIHYPDEVRSAADVPNIPANDTIVKKEIDTAILLIDQLTTTFDPTKYNDDYRTALLELIESKKTGQKTITAKTKETVSNNVTDLMEALQASIDRTKPDKLEGKKTTTRKKAAPKKKKQA
ncbi:non-homologous end joining protein Ku [Peribacillus butanolivorans]|uniref:Non-homologous end joining protein Ku n=1 Tax=Peribacillus butanolivorans TaxID=421767 RepID=A0AAX0S050_9BACI|nr:MULTISPECIES: Ku protein [Peribacillus]AXN37145.1 Ku protein [Peribacillus butanolivorans]MBK5442087.1 Ku protein [Peribacillus sp. TH24]MBK5501345.1 Ku protein [Peribacillus sp. TH14]PEJ32255.1 Ku protein [Peribacillus butanolivorans]QNU04382.1 Ku protein [Peribacillus butanolivorans]